MGKTFKDQNSKPGQKFFVRYDKAVSNCPTCHGQGTILSHKKTVITCTTCNGTGEVQRRVR